MGARFEGLIVGVLMATSDSWYTQVVFKLISVQVCDGKAPALPTPAGSQYIDDL